MTESSRGVLLPLLGFHGNRHVEPGAELLMSLQGRRLLLFSDSIARTEGFESSIKAPFLARYRICPRPRHPGATAHSL